MGYKKETKMKITKKELIQIIKEELKEAFDWDAMDRETTHQYQGVMRDLQRRLQTLDNKDARSIMKSIRQLVKLTPEQQKHTLDAMTDVLATDADPGQVGRDVYGGDQDEPGSLYGGFGESKK